MSTKSINITQNACDLDGLMRIGRATRFVPGATY